MGCGMQEYRMWEYGIWDVGIREYEHPRLGGNQRVGGDSCVFTAGAGAAVPVTTTVPGS